MNNKTTNTAVVVLIINVLSRGLALIANSLISSTFGVNELTSAYSFALTLTNIITTIIGTTLTTSVIPIYTDLRENETLDRANKFINNTVSLTTIVSVILISLGGIFAPIISKLGGQSAGTYGVFAIRVILCSILFMCLYYVFSGLLQANGKFYLVAMVSLPSSIASIVYTRYLSGTYEMWGLAFATVFGFFLQAVLLFFGLKGTKYKFKLSFDYKNEDMYRIFKVVAPVIVGVCAYQINMLTNGSIAYSYDPKKYIVLNNAQNLGIQIVATLVLALVSVVYPKLSYLAVRKEEKEFKEQLSDTISLMLLILIPLAFAYYIYSYDIVDLVYGYGKFSDEYIKLGGSIFALYAFAIPGIGFKEIIDRAFYSYNITKESAVNGVIIMVINIALSIILVRFFGLPGIALAYSVAAFFGGIYILIRFKMRLNLISLKDILIAVIKSLIASLVMTLVLYFIGKINFPKDKTGLIIKLAISGITGIITYFVMLYILKTKEIKNILRKEK